MPAQSRKKGVEVDGKNAIASYAGGESWVMCILMLAKLCCTSSIKDPSVISLLEIQQHIGTEVAEIFLAYVAVA